MHRNAPHRGEPAGCAGLIQGRWVGQIALVAAWFWSIAVPATFAVAGDVSPPVSALAVAPDGMSVVVGSQAGIEVRSWPDLELRRTLSDAPSHVHDLAFSPDGRALLVGGGEPANEGTVDVYSWPNLERIARNDEHADVVYAVAWSGDSTRWASAGLDRVCLVGEAANARVVHRLAGHSRGVTAVCWLADNQTLITAGLDHSLRVWDGKRGHLVRTLDNHTQPVQTLAVRPAADEASLPMLASAGEDRTVRLWQPTIGRMVRFARIEGAAPLAMAWSTDGRWIVVSGTDGRLRVIDPETVQIVRDLPAIEGWAYSLAVHPNSRDVLVGGAKGALQRLTVFDDTPAMRP